MLPTQLTGNSTLDQDHPGRIICLPEVDYIIASLSRRVAGGQKLVNYKLVIHSLKRWVFIKNLLRNAFEISFLHTISNRSKPYKVATARTIWSELYNSIRTRRAQTVLSKHCLLNIRRFPVEINEVRQGDFHRTSFSVQTYN